MPRPVARIAVTLYTIALFLGADYVYSTYLQAAQEWPRYPNPVYHHALVPNFDGYDSWGDARASEQLRQLHRGGLARIAKLRGRKI